MKLSKMSFFWNSISERGTEKKLLYGDCDSIENRFAHLDSTENHYFYNPGPKRNAICKRNTSKYYKKKAPIDVPLLSILKALVPLIPWLNARRLAVDTSNLFLGNKACFLQEITSTASRTLLSSEARFGACIVKFKPNK